MNDLPQYQWLFRRAPAMATLIAEDGVYLDVNDALLTRLGYTRDDMIGERPESFVTEASARRIAEEFRPALRRTGKLENKPVSFVARDGELIDCTTNAIVEYAPDGKVLQTIAMYSEISEQARANLKYRDLYRSMPAMLHTVDGDGQLVTVSDYWLDKLGYRREEVIGRPITDFFSEEDRRRYADGRLQALISEGGFENLERQVVTKRGEVIDLVMSAISQRDARGNVVQMLVASQDVTERNRAERELHQALAENTRLSEELAQERDYLREEVNVALNFGRMVGKSAALKRMLSQVEAVANTPVSVLLIGESGVGKELVARAIHSQSPRAEAPLVKVNCASIPEDLFESEFFGHVKGAFTGAHRDRVGRFQLADGGTIFLDEVGEIPLELQSKLLRVLQESEFERVGDDITRSVDVRVIAATNRDLEQLIVEGRFREDLFYRLSVFPVDVPPLRERGDDVVQLAQHFLEQTCRDFGRDPLKLSRSHIEMLRGYDWPGNVRELKNVIERAVIMSSGKTLRLERSMPEAGATAGAVAAGETGAGTALRVLTEEQMRQLQKSNILNALRQSGGRVSGKGGAAELLGVKPTTLADRIKSYGIRKPSTH